MPKIVATKKDWIELGYKLFTEFGEAGLNVDKMSRILTCNKSSFYWHFKSKKDFVNDLIEYWIAMDTHQVMTKVNAQKSAKDRLLKLIEIAFKKDANLDFIFYLKTYSQKNKQVQETVEQIDKERMSFVTNLFMELGYPQQIAAQKASIFYKYLIGYHEMIRYKRQKKNYLSEVLVELNQFINISL